LLPFFTFQSFSLTRCPSPKPNLELHQFIPEAGPQMAREPMRTARINDRGPFVPGRVIDGPAAARALGFSGLAPVTLDIGRHG
jgi:hypothetical protein